MRRWFARKLASFALWRMEKHWRIAMMEGRYSDATRWSQRQLNFANACAALGVWL